MLSSRASATQHPRAADWQVAAAVALLLLAVYLGTADLRFQSIDEVAVFSVARSLAGHTSFDVDGLFWTQFFTGEGAVVARGVDGHLYSLKDVGLSVLVSPLVWLAYRLGASPVRTAFLINPLLTALTGALLFLAARSFGYRRGAALAGALTFGLASMAWPYAETLFTQPLAALGLLLATWMAVCAFRDADWRRALAAGLALGLATSAAVALWVLLPAYALALAPWERMRSPRWRGALRDALPLLGAFGAGAALFAAAEGAYNAVRFGSPLATGHGLTSGLAFSLRALPVGGLGQLVSLPRGVVWYAPFVLLAPLGAVRMWRTRRRLAALLVAQAALVLLLYSSWFDWGGGLAWGPRFMVTLMPLVALLAVPVFERVLASRSPWPRLAVGALVAASLLVQLAAALYDAAYAQRDIYQRLIDVTRRGDLAAIGAALTDPTLHPYPRLVELAREGVWGVLWMSRGALDWPLLVALLLLAALAGGWLGLTLRGRERRLLTGGLLAQATLTVALVAAMLARYPHAPNGYLSRETPGPAGLERVAAALGELAAPGDGLILLMEDDYISWLDSTLSEVPEISFAIEAPLRPESADMLASVREWYDRVWLVSTGTLRGNWQNGVELWLAHNAHAGTTVFEDDSIALLPFSFPRRLPPPEAARVHFGAGDLELAATSWEIVRRPDAAWLNVLLEWEALAPLPADYSVTVQLWTRDWAPIAQHDGQPGAGFYPMTTWQPGVPVEDRHHIALPPDLPPGPYYLHVGVYDLATGEVVWPVEVPEYLWIPIEIAPE